MRSIRGELPNLNYAIFADTGWELRSVYEHLERLKVEASRVGLRLVVVSAGNIRDDAMRSKVRGKKSADSRFASIPYYTLDEKGNAGQIRRQCTREYKIDPIRKYIRQSILGLKPRQRVPKGTKITQWFGISYDEIGRARTSRDEWIDHYYPLIVDRWTRQDCIKWLRDNYPDWAVPRSACIGCPYHSNAEWRRLQVEAPDEFQEAVDLDEHMRKREDMRGQTYLHRSCRPLKDVDLRSQEELGQIDWINECDGMCGV